MVQSSLIEAGYACKGVWKWRGAKFLVLACSMMTAQAAQCHGLRLTMVTLKAQRIYTQNPGNLFPPKAVRRTQKHSCYNTSQAVIEALSPSQITANISRALGN